MTTRRSWTLGVATLAICSPRQVAGGPHGHACVARPTSWPEARCLRRRPGLPGYHSIGSPLAVPECAATCETYLADQGVRAACTARLGQRRSMKPLGLLAQVTNTWKRPIGGLSSQYWSSRRARHLQPSTASRSGLKVLSSRECGRPAGGESPTNSHSVLGAAPIVFPSPTTRLQIRRHVLTDVSGSPRSKRRRAETPGAQKPLRQTLLKKPKNLVMAA
jgi:hypothetical protein